MTTSRLILRSLRFHWRSHLAVLLCAAAGSAVLTGALLVGDSMRGSLRDLTLDRLGRVDYALGPGRFFRENLIADLSEHPEFKSSRFVLAQPAIALRGGLARVDSSGQETARAGHVQIWAVTSDFWNLTRAEYSPQPAPSHWNESQEYRDTVILSESLALHLDVRVGSTVLLRVDQPSDVPRESTLGRKSDVARTLRLRVASVATTRRMGRFGLEPSQHSPRNAFVPLKTLQEAIGQRGRANTILVSESAGESSAPADNVVRLHRALHDKLRLEDIGLKLRVDASRGYLALESTRMILEPPVAEAAMDAAKEMNLRAAPTLAYLANSITRPKRPRQLSRGRTRELNEPTSLTDMVFRLAVSEYARRNPVSFDPEREIPYSTIVALPVDAHSPVGPLTLADGRTVPQLAEDEILLNTWAAEQLDAKPGDRVELEFFAAEPTRPFETAEATFRVRGIVKMQDVAADPGLVPEYPGVTNAKTLADWDPPFPIDLKRVRREDEDYWKQYRTTPKAFVSLAAGERLWGSRFGKWTSIRLAPGESVGGADETPVAWPFKDPPSVVMSSFWDRVWLEDTRRDFPSALLRRLRPEQFGLVFQPVKAQGLVAAVNGTDFSWLFVSFSFFLIASAAILVTLVFRLGVERRAKELGLLLAVGFDRARLRWLLLGEGLIVAGIGSVAGLAGGLGYAWLMMAGLRTWWLPAVGTSLLELHVTWTSMAIGVSSAVVLAAIAIAFAVRGLTRLSTRALLAGSASESIGLVRTDTRWSRFIGWAGVTLAVVQTLVALVVQVSPAAFFIAGAGLLVACLAFLAAGLASGRDRLVRGHGSSAVARLGARNAARHRGRSVLTAGLVASAAFVIVAVAANRQDSVTTSSDKHSSSGGFSLVAESDLPLFHDFGTPAGRRELGFPVSAESEFDGLGVFRFRLRPGEDASCLNLYRPTRPRILGATREMIARGGFRVGGSLARSPEEKQNPWRLLDRTTSDGAIPAIGDANTVQWILHLGLGERLSVTVEDGREVPLEIVATLDGSIFQSELVISERNFLRLFPSQAGYSYFLIEGGEVESRGSRVQGQNAAHAQPSTLDPRLSTLLEQQLSEFGLDVSPVAERLAEYHAVENTYLSTFQMLGTLGLVLGTVGLGAVVLRNVIERRGELALLRAVGYQPVELVWLVLAENVFLLIAGLAFGSVSALVAVAPHLIGQGSHVPWVSLVSTLATVLFVGLVAGLVSALAAIRTPLLPALRAE